jgi:hypothetical protein
LKVLGSADSLGVSIDGQHPKSIIDQIDLGTFLLPTPFESILPFLDSEGQPYQLVKYEDVEIRPQLRVKENEAAQIKSPHAVHDGDNDDDEEEEDEDAESNG